MKKGIRISTFIQDESLWYFKHRGQCVPLLPDYPEAKEWKSQEKGPGFINFVNPNHGEIVNLLDSDEFYTDINFTPPWNKRHTNDTRWEEFRNTTQYKAFTESITAGLKRVLKEEEDPRVQSVIEEELKRQEKFCSVLWWSMWNNELPLEVKDAWAQRGDL